MSAPRMVLCVSDETLANRGYNVALDDILVESEWIEKDSAEHDTAWRQIIPYVTVVTDDGMVLAYQRQGSEGRLHGLYSIGVGGHIEIEDEPEEGAVFDAFVNGMMRELQEEIGITESQIHEEHQFDDHIVCHETEVDRVHIGIRSVIIVDKDAPQATEEIPEFKWLSVSELVELSMDGQLEEWSEIVFDKIAVTLSKMGVRAERERCQHDD